MICFITTIDLSEVHKNERFSSFSLVGRTAWFLLFVLSCFQQTGRKTQISITTEVVLFCFLF
jgi:hypothetical protein